MEERIVQPTELQGPATVIAAAPSPPRAVRSGDEAPALSSGDETDRDEFEFEFPFVSSDSPAGTAALADELFADGRIRTFYPVFGRGGVVRGHGGAAQPAPAAPRVRGQLGRLFLEESRARNSSTSSTASSSSSAATDEDGGGGLEGAPPESYCLWTPGSSSPRPPRKSTSTGSMARWRRISALVVGRSRSHSDGKERFLFLPTPPHDAPPGKDKPRPKPSQQAGVRKKTPAAAVAAEVDTVAAAHRTAYVANGSGVGTPRRTFLPYREELVGFFASVNGISRSHHHPFGPPMRAQMN